MKRYVSFIYQIIFFLFVPFVHSLFSFLFKFAYFLMVLVSVAACGLPLAAVSGAALPSAARAPHGSGWSLWYMGGMQNPPTPGIEPVSPALAGGLLSTGKS